MGRAPCCAKVGLHRGPWTSQEDSLLINYIRAHGEGLWRSLPKKAGNHERGLLRCGKSCRLRWLNYLRPDIKRGNISPEEDDLIIRLHALLGNKWSLIAGRLPGRTDNEIKNYWNTRLSKKLRSEGAVPPKRKRSNTKKEKSSKTGNGRPPVHIPKPVRVTSLTSTLKRNNSLESSVTDVSASTREGSAYWPSDAYDGPGGVRFLRGECGADDDLANVTVHPLASDLDKLYEEYLQLLKSDDDHDYLDHSQARELDCFAESLLI